MSEAGLLPPLFERLAAQADEAQAFDREAMAESVRQELARLLNTRRASARSAQPLTILDYGIGDWSALQARRSDDRRQLVREIRAAVQHFEPRLQLTEVEAEPVPGQPQRLRLRLGGSLRSGQRSWPAVFVIDNNDEGLEVSHERLD
ncbi:type VI secretion system baseplate subunit TssE [Pseudomonas sp. JS3066]|uniref:type VI secretion system baseplate subunit TssE n=1 Tax=unclassified Pseudomonas TaxID=196821 RepID=UPI000EAA7D39|nr:MULTISPECIES: type VI secretion system baseplate subunit TssE [unclassified Pseudomonas]AYF87089.1 type VI secretion system baseplate subunit TssE [Pseudomonas sp. DY-1]MDH4655413.1 type VI secretion system baseplate subunit TssE [Pseudomonas sp. BN606]MRK22278.1 type VI secretion system baseplate subunit TssE [Pseudomonas sp. JG-B]WVK95403.1 type VI secretion system baseplate subunit TssE [Pseudomonas sp. JS3066]